MPPRADRPYCPPPLATPLDGKFCEQNVKWRVSFWCNLSGFICQLASFGSLQFQIAVSMTTTRCYVISSKLNFRMIIMITIVLNVINFVLAFVPPAGTFSRTTRLSDWLQNKSWHLFCLLTAYQKVDNRTELRKQSSYTLISQRQNLTAEEKTFNYDNIRLHGYYGSCNVL